MSLDDNDRLLAGSLPLDPEDGLEQVEVHDPEPERPTTNRPPAGANRVFDRGDDVELGHDLAARVAPPGFAVADEGAVYRFGSGGVWTEVLDDWLSKVAQGYAGRMRWKIRHAEVLPIFLSAGNVKGIVQSARIRLSRPGFFADRPHGAAFGDTFVRVCDGRLVYERLTRGHRVRAAEAVSWYLPSEPEAPVTLRFLRETWDGCEDLESRISYLLQWLGVARLGLATKYKDSPLLVGAKDTGKSRLLDAIKAAFPSAAQRSIALHSLSKDHYRAHLRDALLNSVSELPSREMLRSEEAKAILSGDPVSACAKYRAPFTLVSRCAHIFATNELPPSLDPALRDRFVVVDCPNVVPPDRQDRNLAAKLAEEAPHFVALALRTVEDTLERGYLLPPPSSPTRAEEWAIASDPCGSGRRHTLNATTMAGSEAARCTASTPPGLPTRATRRSARRDGRYASRGWASRSTRATESAGE